MDIHRVSPSFPRGYVDRRERRRMRVLVTGGAGFIGSTIVDALKARGDAVVVVDDISTGDRANGAPDIAPRVADVSDAKALREAVRGESFDALVHCASKTKVVESMEKPDLYRRGVSARAA